MKYKFFNTLMAMIFLVPAMVYAEKSPAVTIMFTGALAGQIEPVRG